MVADGLGSYRLETSTPSVGGTWVAEATIKNEVTGTTNNAIYLWRRTDQSAPTTVRPLKFQSGVNAGLKEMSDVDIATLNVNFRNAICNNGIGQYKLQQSSPSPGTWVSVGNTFSDTRQQLASNTYTLYYSGYTIGSFVGNTIQSATETISTVSLWIRTA